MKGFKAEQVQKSCNFADNCVDASSSAKFGGGAI